MATNRPTKTIPHPLSDETLLKIFSQINKSEEGCWNWTGRLDAKGYGVIYLPVVKEVKVTRVIWEIYNGPIPEGLFILHRCDVPKCVRPDHLYAGTHRDNMIDMVDRGRSTKGRKRENKKGENEN